MHARLVCSNNNGPDAAANHVSAQTTIVLENRISLSGTGRRAVPLSSKPYNIEPRAHCEPVCPVFSLFLSKFGLYACSPQGQGPENFLEARNISAQSCRRLPLGWTPVLSG
jgi:hypothetical protein